jgi:hypothetical protein
MKSMEDICKLKLLTEGMEPDGLMETDKSEYKGIQVINYILAPRMLTFKNRASYI